MLPESNFMVITSGNGVSELRARSLVQLHSSPLNPEQRGERAYNIVSEKSAADIFIEHPVDAHAVMYDDQSVLIVIPRSNVNLTPDDFDQLIEYVKPRLINLSACVRLSSLCIGQ